MPDHATPAARTQQAAVPAGLGDFAARLHAMLPGDTWTRLAAQHDRRMDQDDASVGLGVAWRALAENLLTYAAIEGGTGMGRDTLSAGYERVGYGYIFPAEPG